MFMSRQQNTIILSLKSIQADEMSNALNRMRIIAIKKHKLRNLTQRIGRAMNFREAMVSVSSSTKNCTWMNCLLLV